MTSSNGFPTIASVTDPRFEMYIIRPKTSRFAPLSPVMTLRRARVRQTFHERLVLERPVVRILHKPKRRLKVVDYLERVLDDGVGELYIGRVFRFTNVA